MCALISLALLILGFVINEPLIVVASGLFAIGAEIAAFRDREREDK